MKLYSVPFPSLRSGGRHCLPPRVMLDAAAALVVFACALSFPHLAYGEGAPVTYDVVARAAGPAAGTAEGVTFRTFGSPAIGPTGEVVFGADLQGPGLTTSTDSALFSGLPGAISPLALSGAPAPGTNANYGPIGLYGFQPLPIKTGGQVLFSAPLTNQQPGGPEGLFIGKPGAVTLIGRSGERAPNTEAGVFFQRDTPFGGSIRRYALSDAGQIAFSASLSGPRASVGLFAGAPGSLRLAARTGSPAPGAGGATFSQWYGAIGINAEGAVAFQGILSDGGEGIWLGQPGALELAVRPGTPAPGTAGNFESIIFRGSLNNNNQIAFRARARDGVAGSASLSTGIWAGTPGSLDLIALTGQPAPGTANNFFGFEPFSPAINNSGEVAFHGALDGRSGIWAGAAGALELVALHGAAAPLGAGSPSAQFSQFGPLILNQDGQVAFHALLEAEDGTSSGWSYWATDTSGELRLIAREGGVLDLGGGDLRTIAQLPAREREFDRDIDFMSLSTGSGRGQLFFNDAGQLTFRAIFGDGTEAIIVANVPEPGAAAIAGVAGALLLGRPRGRGRRPPPLVRADSSRQD